MHGAKYSLAERLRDGLDDSDRRGIGRSVIDDMKKNLGHRPLRGTGGIVVTGSDCQLGTDTEGPLGLRDGSSSMEAILEGLPDFEKNKLTTGNNGSSHVRISHGEFIAD